MESDYLYGYTQDGYIHNNLTSIVNPTPKL